MSYRDIVKMISPHIAHRDNFNGFYIILGTIQNLWWNQITFLVFTESVQQWLDCFLTAPQSR